MVRTWLISVISVVGFLIGVYLLLIYGLPLVAPFVVALISAELVDPIVTWLTWKGRIPRALTAITVILLFMGLMITALTAGMARLVVEIQDMTASWPYLYATGRDLSARFAEQFGAFHASLPASIQSILMRNLSVLEETVSGFLPSMQTTLGVFRSLPAILTNMLVAVIATFFISRDRRQIFDFLLSLFPETWRPKIRKVKADVWSSSLGFVKAQVFLITLTMIQTIIGLSWIGARYSVLAGVVVGVADMLPLLGPASIFIPWIAYCFIFGSKVFGIKLFALYLVVAVVRMVLEPKLVGDQLGLHPLTILLSVYLGFYFFGAAGFALGPLLAIGLKAMMHSGLLPALQDPHKQ